MKLEKKFSFPVASRALAFVLASATFAACSSTGNGGSMVPPTDGGAPPMTSTMPETSATPLVTASPNATATPSTGTQSVVSVSGSTATVTGNVVAVKTGAFQIQGGSGLGYLWIYTTSTTKYSGSKPYVGENVEVTGTGSLSTSLTATSVTQLGTTSTTTTTSTATLSLSGKVDALKTGAFQIQGGSGVGYVWIYTTSSTTYTGSKPYVGESVSVKASGSLSTKVTAISVTQSGTTSTTTSSTPAPTTTTTTTSSTNVAHYAGCPVFTAGDYYNAPITSAAIDAHSSSYISSQYSAGNTYGFYASTGYEKVNQANNSTPLLTVKQKVSYHTFPVKYPWQSGFYIEPLSDAHGMVVQTQSCHLYESYSTTFSGGVLSAYSGANWDLTKPFVPMPAGSPSAMASGLSIFAGMVKWEDYQSGAIRHALNWAAPAGTVAAWKFVRPASDTDGLAFKGTSSYQLPYGAHLRLKASFSTAGMGPEATMVINAMKTYGIYLADTGSSSNALYFANSATGTDPWNHSDLSALSKVHITDFDVVTLPSIMTVPGH